MCHISSISSAHYHLHFRWKLCSELFTPSNVLRSWRQFFDCLQVSLHRQGETCLICDVHAENTLSCLDESLRFVFNHGSVELRGNVQWMRLSFHTWRIVSVWHILSPSRSFFFKLDKVNVILFIWWIRTSICIIIVTPRFFDSRVCLWDWFANLNNYDLEVVACLFRVERESCVVSPDSVSETLRDSPRSCFLDRTILPISKILTSYRSLQWTFQIEYGTRIWVGIWTWDCSRRVTDSSCSMIVFLSLIIEVKKDLRGFMIFVFSINRCEKKSIMSNSFQKVTYWKISLIIESRLILIVSFRELDYAPPDTFLT